MLITSAIKGQLTKLRNGVAAGKWKHGEARKALRSSLERTMPREQAKHAARKLYTA